MSLNRYYFEGKEISRMEAEDRVNYAQQVCPYAEEIQSAWMEQLESETCREIVFDFTGIEIVIG